MNDVSINPDLSQTGPLSAIWYIGSIFQAVGNAAISNLAPLFAIGLGFRMAKDFRGEACFGGIFWMSCNWRINGNCSPMILQ